MNKNERQNLKQDAALSLEAGVVRPAKLVLLHTAISSGLALLAALLSFLLDQKIAGTGGLSGVSLRAGLQTVQSFLQMATMLLTPFWAMGLVGAFLRIRRREETGFRDLLAGFRSFGPVLRGKLLQYLMLTGAGFLGSYAAMFVFSISPFGHTLQEALLPYIPEDTMEYTMDFVAIMEDEAVMKAMVWAVPFALLGILVAVVPMYYRLRLMDFVLMDHPEWGARRAMQLSRGLMKGKCFDLFKLDLSFWWFYLLELVVSVICYGDVLLPMVGVELGISQNTAFFLFYVLALVVQLGLYVWKKPLLMATYAGYYDALRPQPPEAKPPVVEYTP